MSRPTGRKARLGAVAIAVALGALASRARAQDLEYVTRITGVKDEDLYAALERVSRLKALETKPVASLSALRRRAAKDLERFSKVLRSEGYYDHSLQYRLDTTETPIRVRVHVELGSPYQLASFDVVLRGEELDPATEAVERARRQLELGKRARASDIVKTEDLVLRQLARNAYPFPKLVDREAIVDHATRSLRVRTTIDTGKRARFGPIAVTGVRESLAEFAGYRVPWKEGELYDPEQLETLRTRLAATGLFSTIRIKPAEAVTEEGLLPITVELQRGKQRSVGAGVYYSSSDGPGGSVYWEHRDLFGRAERLRLAGEVAEIGESGKLIFRKPDFLSPSQTLDYDAAYEVQDTEAFESRKFKTALGVERPFARHWTAIVAGAFEIGPVDEGEGDEDFVLVGVPLMLRRDTSNDLLDPSKGSKLELSATPYLEQIGSDLSFVVSRIGETLYFPFDERRRFVLAGRASVGSISGADRSEIPADKRFYAGGGGSVRGYAFQHAGPLDFDEDPVGGRSLFESGLELRWRFWKAFGVVPFVDVGSVFEQVYPAFNDELFWGAGLGFRYYSPVGPIRLDIATPLNPRSGIDDPVQFYISLGQAY